METGWPVTANCSVFTMLAATYPSLQELVTSQMNCITRTSRPLSYGTSVVSVSYQYCFGVKFDRLELVYETVYYLRELETRDMSEKGLERVRI